MQQGDLCDAKKMQAHNDNNDAGNGRERPGIDADERANNAGAGAKRHKHSRKAEYEQSCCSYSFALYPRFRLLVRKTLKRSPR